MTSPAESAVVVVDVDGTLVPRGGDIPPEAAVALTKLSQMSVLLILATGRPLPSVQLLAEAVPLAVDVVTSNGNYVRARDGAGGVVEPFPVRVVNRAVDVAALSRAHALCYSTEGCYYACSGDPALEAVLTLYSEPPLLRVGRTELRRRVGEYAHIHLVRPEGWHESINVRGATTAASEPPYMTLTPLGVTKATGVQALLAHHRWPPGPIYVVADGENDLPLFDLPRVVSVAMGSGHPRLREKADIVAPAVDEGGFAWAVDAVVLPAITKENA